MLTHGCNNTCNLVSILYLPGLQTTIVADWGGERLGWPILFGDSKANITHWSCVRCCCRRNSADFMCYCVRVKSNFHALHASYVLVSKILQVVLICQHMGVLTPVILYLPAQAQHWFIPALWYGWYLTIGLLIFIRFVFQHLGIFGKLLRDPLCYWGSPLDLGVSIVFGGGSKVDDEPDGVFRGNWLEFLNDLIVGIYSCC